MNRRRIVLCLGVIALMGFVGCQTQAADGLSDADRTAIRDAFQAQMTAANAGDAATWASWFTEDAVRIHRSEIWIGDNDVGPEFFYELRLKPAGTARAPVLCLTACDADTGRQSSEGRSGWRH